VNVNLEIEINGKTRTFNVPVEIAQYIGDLRQQNTMLRKVMEKDKGGSKPKDK